MSPGTPFLPCHLQHFLLSSHLALEGVLRNKVSKGFWSATRPRRRNDVRECMRKGRRMPATWLLDNAVDMLR